MNIKEKQFLMWENAYKEDKKAGKFEQNDDYKNFLGIQHILRLFHKFLYF